MRAVPVISKSPEVTSIEELAYKLEQQIRTARENKIIDGDVRDKYLKDLKTLKGNALDEISKGGRVKEDRELFHDFVGSLSESLILATKAKAEAKASETKEDRAVRKEADLQQAIIAALKTLYDLDPDAKRKAKYSTRMTQVKDEFNDETTSVWELYKAKLNIRIIILQQFLVAEGLLLTLNDKKDLKGKPFLSVKGDIKRLSGVLSDALNEGDADKLEHYMRKFEEFVSFYRDIVENVSRCQTHMQYLIDLKLEEPTLMQDLSVALIGIEPNTPSLSAGLKRLLKRIEREASKAEEKVGELERVNNIGELRDKLNTELTYLVEIKKITPGKKVEALNEFAGLWKSSLIDMLKKGVTSPDPSSTKPLKDFVGAFSLMAQVNAELKAREEESKKAVEAQEKEALAQKAKENEEQVRIAKEKEEKVKIDTAKNEEESKRMAQMAQNAVENSLGKLREVIATLGEDYAILQKLDPARKELYAYQKKEVLESAEIKSFLSPEKPKDLLSEEEEKQNIDELSNSLTFHRNEKLQPRKEMLETFKQYKEQLEHLDRTGFFSLQDEIKALPGKISECFQATHQLKNPKAQYGKFTEEYKQRVVFCSQVLLCVTDYQSRIEQLVELQPLVDRGRIRDEWTEQLRLYIADPKQVSAHPPTKIDAADAALITRLEKAIALIDDKIKVAQKQSASQPPLSMHFTAAQPQSSSKRDIELRSAVEESEAKSNPNPKKKPPSPGNSSLE